MRDLDWRRLKELVTEAEGLDPDERRAFLVERCGDDPELLAEAESLLAPDLDKAEDFLERPALAGITAEPLQAGQRLGPYRIVRKLGSGGMGDVYLGERADGTYDEQVAIKVIRTALGPPELQARFLSERRLLAELRHPHIARLLDAGSLEDGRPYFALEYVEGSTIARHCRSQSLTVKKIVELMAKVAGAVAHAHRHPVVHRDLKPANILVGSDGEPKLLDFGIAKDLRDDPQTPATHWLRPFTPRYASPEQLADQPVTTATDVYSLGIVLYELLADESPFGEDGDPLSGRSRSSRPTRPSLRVKDRPPLSSQLSGDLDALVLKALAPGPEQRYSSVEAMEQDMRRYLQGQPLEARSGRLYRAGKWVRRNRLGVAAGLIVAVSGLGWVRAEIEAGEAQERNRAISVSTTELGEYLVDVLMAADPDRTGEKNPAFDAMLRRGAGLLDQEKAFDESPLVRAALQTVIGQVQRNYKPEEAAVRLRESLELRRKHLKPGDPEIAVAANNLALALRSLEQYEGARELLVESLEIFQGAGESDPRLLASTLSNLAGVEMELGHHDDAIQYFRQALELKAETWPSQHKMLSTAQKNLAAGYLAAERLAEAERYLDLAEQSLEAWGRDEPLARSGIDHHRGVLAWKRGETDEARKLLGSAYGVRRKILGEDERRTRLSRKALLEIEGELEPQEKP